MGVRAAEGRIHGFTIVVFFFQAEDGIRDLTVTGVQTCSDLLTTATVIESFGTAFRFATFLIPASLGALEGGYVVTFAALGLGSTTAVSFSLVRRVREAVWVGLGLLVFALARPAARPLADSPSARRI